MGTSSNTYLLYHAVFSTKNRQKLLVEQNRARLFAYMAGIIKNIGGLPVLINGIEDHLHVLAFLPRHVSISESMQNIKGKSSHWYNQEFGHCFPRIHWQEGYNIFSVSGSDLETVKNYIFNQEEHHRKFDYTTEMQKFDDKLHEYYDPGKWEVKPGG